MKERTKGKAKIVVVTVLMLAVLLGGFCGGVLYEKANTEPVITFYRTQVDESFALLQEYDRVLQERTTQVDAWQWQRDQVLIMADSYRQSAEEYREALVETVDELRIAQKEAEGYQVALVEAEGQLVEAEDQLDQVSEMIEVTQQEKTDLLSQVENLKREGYIPFSSEAEIREYVKSTGISQREYVPTTYDCDDFAIDLVVQAYKDKRMIGLWGYSGHLKCFAIEGNNIYGVEPQNNRIDIVAVVD